MEVIITKYHHYPIGRYTRRRVHEVLEKCHQPRTLPEVVPVRADASVVPEPQFGPQIFGEDNMGMSFTAAF
jgi:hypothetical protein